MVRILDRNVEIAFWGDDIDQEAILASVQAMATLINSTSLTDKQREVFGHMRKIVFFTGKVTVNGYEMDRPCCDEDDATFYWEVEEFVRNMDADVHANTLFHDCWHVEQYLKSGYAKTEAERIDREIDAIVEQIDVAERLGCDAREIDHLKGFGSNRERILARLEEGVDTNMLHTPRTAQV